MKIVSVDSRCTKEQNGPLVNEVGSLCRYGKSASFSNF